MYIWNNHISLFQTLIYHTPKRRQYPIIQQHIKRGSKNLLALVPLWRLPYQLKLKAFRIFALACVLCFVFVFVFAIVFLVPLRRLPGQRKSKSFRVFPLTCSPLIRRSSSAPCLADDHDMPVIEGLAFFYELLFVTIYFFLATFYNFPSHASISLYCQLPV